MSAWGLGGEEKQLRMKDMACELLGRRRLSDLCWRCGVLDLQLLVGKRPAVAAGPRRAAVAVAAGSKLVKAPSPKSTSVM